MKKCLRMDRLVQSDIQCPLTQHLLARYIAHGTVIPATLLDRVVKIGESPVRCVFRESKVERAGCVNGANRQVDSIRQRLYSSEEYQPW